MKRSNITCTYLGTGYPRNRSSFFRPVFSTGRTVDSENNFEEYPNDEEENATVPISLEGRQGQFKEVITVHQKYTQRPEILENVCLAQFATSYHYIKSENIPKGIEWVNNASIQTGKASFSSLDNAITEIFVGIKPV